MKTVNYIWLLFDYVHTLQVHGRVCLMLIMKTFNFQSSIFQLLMKIFVTWFYFLITQNQLVYIFYVEEVNCKLNYHDQKIRQTLVRDIQKH